MDFIIGLICGFLIGVITLPFLIKYYLNKKLKDFKRRMQISIRNSSLGL